MNPNKRTAPGRMTAEELRDARKRLGMAGKDFAKEFMISSARQLYAMEAGTRNGHAAHIPPAVEFLIRQRLAQLDQHEKQDSSK